MVEIPSVPFTNCVTDGRLLTLFDFSVLVSKMRILIVTLPSAEDEMRWREVSVSEPQWGVLHLNFLVL